jgi:hypothetical protein
MKSSHFINFSKYIDIRINKIVCVDFHFINWKGLLFINYKYVILELIKD